MVYVSGALALIFLVVAAVPRLKRTRLLFFILGIVWAAETILLLISLQIPA